MYSSTSPKVAGDGLVPQVLPQNCCQAAKLAGAGGVIADARASAEERMPFATTIAYLWLNYNYYLYQHDEVSSSSSGRRTR